VSATTIPSLNWPNAEAAKVNSIDPASEPAMEMLHRNAEWRIMVLSSETHDLTK
jgi:hypothetical protein